MCIAPIALGAAPAKPKTPPKPVQKTPATKPVSGVNSPNSKAKLNLELTDKTKFTIDDAKGKIVLLYFWMSSAESTSEMSVHVLTSAHGTRRICGSARMKCSSLGSDANAPSPVTLRSGSAISA